MELLFQFAADFLVQLLTEITVDFGFNFLRPADQRIKNPIFLSVGFFAWGLFAGGISLWPFPSAFIVSPELRLFNLFVTPLAIGGIMLCIGKAKEKHRYDRVNLEQFGYALAFAFAMALVRFIFAK
jgi:hypothetical protein